MQGRLEKGNCGVAGKRTQEEIVLVKVEYNNVGRPNRDAKGLGR